MNFETPTRDETPRSAATSRILISAVISQEVDLQPLAEEWRGTCPFHVDSLRGLHVNDKVGAFICFSCGRTGDAVDWLMERRELSEAEAIACLLEISDARGDRSASPKGGDEPTAEGRAPFSVSKETSCRPDGGLGNAVSPQQPGSPPADADPEA